MVSTKPCAVQSLNIMININKIMRVCIPYQLPLTTIKEAAYPHVKCMISDY